eukprot:3354609-Pyramimonas_sp.AAC.1
MAQIVCRAPESLRSSPLKSSPQKDPTNPNTARKCRVQSSKAPLPNRRIPCKVFAKAQPPRQMPPRRIESLQCLSPASGENTVWLLDQFGVLHDGQKVSVH